MQNFTLFTTRYQRFRPEMGAPIQSSNGRPRWKLPYDLEFAAVETFPPRKTIRWSQRPFEEAYREHLDSVGVEKLASRFRALVTATGQERLVLMCFEELSKPGEHCHRRCFAQWWEEHTGDPVIELGPTGPDPSLPRFSNESLF